MGVAARWRIGVWLLCAVTVLWAGWKNSRIPSVREALRVPSTPLDLTSPSAGRLWRFLKEARLSVPDKASYTIHAAQRDDEMTLFMLSRGIFETQEALPTSYFGIATPEQGRHAVYVLVYGRCPESFPGLQRISQTADGCVFQRNPLG